MRRYTCDLRGLKSDDVISHSCKLFFPLRLNNHSGNLIDNLPIVHVDTYSNPNQVKKDFENRKLNQIIEDFGISEDQWLFIISENGMIIAKFQGYASLEQIEEYLN